MDVSGVRRFPFGPCHNLWAPIDAEPVLKASRVGSTPNEASFSTGYEMVVSWDHVWDEKSSIPLFADCPESVEVLVEASILNLCFDAQRVVAICRLTRP